MTFTETFGIVLPLLILIFSIIAHEVAHGLAAYIHGDTTARDAGRLTLNPIPHIDLFGSIIIPALSLLFTNYTVGWAKPVPYNPRNLVGKYAEAWVSAAGVLTNFCIAFLAYLIATIFVLPPESTLFLPLFLIFWTNISLGFFNLIPVPPFDGMSILQSLFPQLRLMTQRFTYSPLYMIGVIILATFIYDGVSPYLISFALRAFHLH
jgi:Zn-dependent protease